MLTPTRRDKLIFAFVHVILFSVAWGQTMETVWDDCDLTSYYKDAQGLALDVTPTRAALEELLTRTHRRVLPYTDNREGRDDIWKALLDLDAGATADSVTLIYSQTDMTNAATVKGTPTGWNREHVWPKSRGVGDGGADFTDIHHLKPSDWNINAARSNKWFGACENAGAVSCASPAHPEAAVDTEASPTTFLPPAAARGQIARAVLYMDVRYSASNNNGFDLQLTNCFNETSVTGKLGYLSQIIAWHNQFPVTNAERKRNDRACSRWQGNRNPFVDHPEWVDAIFGDGTACVVTPSDPIITNTTNSTCPTAGSIMVVGVNTDNPDAIAFVALKDIPAGTTLYLTDNEWTPDGGLGTTEGTWRTEIVDTTIPAGTVWGPAVSTVPIWETYRGSLALSASGDSLLLYCQDDDDDDESNHWISGFSLEGSAVEWPSDLEGVAVTLDHIDNVRYVGPTTGSQSMLIDAIRQPIHWQGSNSDRFVLDPSEWSFQVNSWASARQSNCQTVGGVVLLLLSTWMLCG